VLRGATVGDGCLIGTASVVRGDIPARTVAVGAPARVLRAVREGEAR
jgi:acetyltransferase-like isoleucine patch superfamily enzyme